MQKEKEEKIKHREERKGLPAFRGILEHEGKGVTRAEEKERRADDVRDDDGGGKRKREREGERKRDGEREKDREKEGEEREEKKGIIVVTPARLLSRLLVVVSELVSRQNYVCELASTTAQLRLTAQSVHTHTIRNLPAHAPLAPSSCD